MKRFREVGYLGVETGCLSAMSQCSVARNPHGVGNLLPVLPWLGVVAALSSQCSSGVPARVMAGAQRAGWHPPQAVAGGSFPSHDTIREGFCHCATAERGI